MSQDPLIGQTLAEYRVDGVLGRGGMGVVYAAEDTALGIPVALKTIDRGLARDEAFVRRFRAEARSMARASSPHIVRVMALRETEEAVFIVMERVDGGTIWDVIHAPRPAGQAGVPWAEAWPLVQQMLSALQAAHAVGVVHRDIKPRNVMLDNAGTIKITDFGLAKVYADATGEQTVTQAVAGTLLYMSPEQVRGEKRLDGRSDLFSLGLTIYEMLAGRLPFDRDAGEFAVMQAIVAADFKPPSHWGADIPREVEGILMRALAGKKEDRPDSADAFCDALAAATPAGMETRTLRPLAARRGSTSDATRTVAAVAAPAADPTRRPLWVAGGAAGLVALVVAAFLLWPRADPTPPDPVTIDGPDATVTVAVPDDSSAAVPAGPVAGGEAVIQPQPVQPQPVPQQQVPTQTVQPPPQQQVVQPRPQPVAPPPVQQPGYVSVVPKPGLSYTVNGSPAAAPVALGPGRYTVVCTAGGLTATQTVRVTAGQTVSSECHATPLLVNVVATTDGPPAWAQVSLDGSPAGQTPTRLELAPGRHRVSIQRAGFEVLTGTQTVDNPPRFTAGAPAPARLVFQMRATGG